jgi:hypothetical protein
MAKRHGGDSSVLGTLTNRQRFRRGALALSALLLGSVHAPASADEPSTQRAPGYHWSENITIASPQAGRQRAETELATDKNGRVWLAYLDADYHQIPDGLWIAAPRALTLLSSGDDGKSFGDPHVLAAMGGNAALVASPAGGLYASWIQYKPGPFLQQKVMVGAIDDTGAFTTALQCPGWAEYDHHDQSDIAVSADGTVYVIGVDIGPPIGKNEHLPVLFARVGSGLHVCSDRQKLPSLEQLPQLAVTAESVFIVGANGYLRSTDGGHSFAPRELHRFANLLVRVAVSPDHRTVYVVGDALRGGLWLSATSDSGKTWRKTRVDTAGDASAWRYPAIRVEASGRVHVVWMDDRGKRGGAVYHAYSDDGGQSFSENARVSDRPFYFPADFPPPPPATQNGTWIGDYLSLTLVHDKVVVAWSDQRAGTPLSAVYAAVGSAP